MHRHPFVTAHPQVMHGHVLAAKYRLPEGMEESKYLTAYDADLKGNPILGMHSS
jgi:hypothetical protein